MLSLVLVGALAVQPDRTVEVGGLPVRTRWFVLLGLVVLTSISFSRRFGTLEACFSQAIRCHLVRVGVAGVPFVLGYGATLIIAPADTTVRAWFAILMAATVAICSIGPDAGWLAALVLGSGSILVDHQSYTQPISRLVDSVGEKGGLALVVVSVATHLMMRSSGVSPVGWRTFSLRLPSAGGRRRGR